MCSATDLHRWLKTERPPSVDDVEQTTLQEFQNVLTQWFANIQRAILSGDILPTNEVQVRVGVEEALSEFHIAYDLVFEAMWGDGAQAGRESAARRHGFDIDFEITRPEVEEALEENAERAGRQVKQRMTGDIVDGVLDAHERGLGIDEIAQELSEDVFQSMETWQARRVAQTEVISASNKGNLTAYRDAAGVTGKNGSQLMTLGLVRHTTTLIIRLCYSDNRSLSERVKRCIQEIRRFRSANG